MSTETKHKIKVKVKEHTLFAEQLSAELVTDRRIKLTEELAFKFLEMPTFAGERSVSETHVQYLYDQYSTGRFMWEQAQIATAILGDKQYRINGQHTCWMRVNVGNMKEEPQVRELIYRVQNEENLRAVYCTFDRNKVRSNGHSLKALLVGSTTAANLWTSGLGHLGRGLIFWKFGDSPQARAMTPEDVAALITGTYSDLFQSVGLIWQDVYESFVPIKRIPVISALFATVEARPNEAKEFWGPVATGLGLNVKTDARYQLRRFLETHGRGLDLEQSSAEDMFRVCIGAWNRWRKNEPVQVLKTTDKRVKPV